MGDVDLRFLSLWFGFQTTGILLDKWYLIALGLVFMLKAYEEELREVLPRFKDWLLYEKIGITSPEQLEEIRDD